MTTIFVTGGTGFIGKEMIEELAKNGHTLLALIRSRDKWERTISSLSPEERNRCIGVVGDLARENLGLSAADYQLVLTSDMIIHAGVPMNILLGEETARDVILQGTKRLLDVVTKIHQQKGLQKLIHVVGYMSPFTDESAASTENVFSMPKFMKEAGGYERYKFLADLLIRQETAREGIPLAVVNPSTVIGPRHTGNTEQVDGFGLLVDSVRRGKMPVLLGGKEWWLPLVPVDDLAKLIASLIEPQEKQVETYFALNDRDEIPHLPDMIRMIAKELRIAGPTISAPVPLIRKILRWGGSRLMGVPAGSLDFVTKKEFPVQSFQAAKDRLGITGYDSSGHLPHVIADLDYRLSAKQALGAKGFVRERVGNLAAYKREGVGSPWVLLHGLFSDMEDLLPLASNLSQEAVWLLDLPGFGRSPHHHQGDGTEGYIDAVVQAINESPVPVHLVGHSLGGYIAWRVAQRVLHKIEQLYLLQPPLHAPRYPAATRLAGKSNTLLRAALQKQSTPRHLEQLFLQQGVFQNKAEIPANYLEKVAGTLQSPRIRQTHADLLGFLMRDFAGIDGLPPLDIPVRIIWGTRDKAFQLSAGMEKTLLDAQIELRKLGAAHHFPIAHPAMTAEILSDLRVSREA